MFTHTSVTSHLWLHQSRLYLTNAGLFVSGDQGILLDPGIYPHEITRWREFAAAHLLHLTHIVLTHSHWDHILGPEYFPTLAIITHHEYLAQTAGVNGAKISQTIESWFATEKIEREMPFVLPQPTLTFSQQMTLRVGVETVQFIHAPGHAADQLVMYHAATGLLWASDILSDVEIPFVSHSLAAYERTLAMLAGWNIQVLVPGHGHIAHTPTEIEGRIHRDREYLAEVRGRVTHSLQQGHTLPETIALCTSIPYHYPAENALPHQRNIESVYLELGGEANGTPIGWESEP